jgi:hypothetical protein
VRVAPGRVEPRDITRQLGYGPEHRIAPSFSS